MVKWASHSSSLSLSNPVLKMIMPHLRKKWMNVKTIPPEICIKTEKEIKRYNDPKRGSETVIIYRWHDCTPVAQLVKTACQCKRRKRRGFNPWIGKIPWRREWHPTPVFLPGKFHGQRSLVGYSPWGHKRVRHDWALTSSAMYIIQICIKSQRIYTPLKLISEFSKIIRYNIQNCIFYTLLIIRE